jgi:hypothetical protein
LFHLARVTNQAVAQYIEAVRRHGEQSEDFCLGIHMRREYGGARNRKSWELKSRLLCFFGAISEAFRGRRPASSTLYHPGAAIAALLSQ